MLKLTLGSGHRFCDLSCLPETHVFLYSRTLEIAQNHSQCLQHQILGFGNPSRIHKTDQTRTHNLDINGHKWICIVFCMTWEHDIMSNLVFDYE